MKRLKKGSVLAVILALMVTLTAFVLPTAYVSAEGSVPAEKQASLPAKGDLPAEPSGMGLITVTFTVTGSKIIEKPEDHEDALEPWLTTDCQVEPGTTLRDLTEELLDRPGEGRHVTFDGDFLTSITIDGKTNEAGKTNGAGSYWLWYLGDALGPVSAGAYELQTGDVIEWRFFNDPNYPSSIAQETADPPHDMGPTPDYWTTFGSNNDRSAVKAAESVAKPEKKVYWGRLFGELNAWGTCSNSDLLVIGDDIYFATGNTLFRVNNKGVVVSQAMLRGDIGYFARLAYDNGLILVPLQGAAIQAINASTMKTVWVAHSLDFYAVFDNDTMERHDYVLQDMSSLLIADGIAYSSTVAIDGEWKSVGGYLRAIDMKTGETIWKADRSFFMDELFGWGGQGAGFYWSGPLKLGKWIVAAGEDGALWAFDTETGDHTLFNNAWPVMPMAPNRSPKIRSSLVHHEGNIYLTTNDGQLHRMLFDAESGEFDPASQFGADKSVKFALASTSTPTIYNGKIYVGGLKEAWSFPGIGVFAVIDLETFEIERSFEIEGEVKATPLVVIGKNDKPYVYFTANNENGALYVYDGEEVTTAYLPEPDKRQYGTASPVIDRHGNIYYTNDSGYLFSLRDEVPAFALVLDDDDEGYPEFLEIVLKGLVKGELIWDGKVTVKKATDPMYQEIANRQFGDDRVMLLDIELVDIDGASIPVVSDCSQIGLDFNLAASFVEGSSSVTFYYFNDEQKEFEKATAASYDEAKRLLSVTFDHFSTYAIVAKQITEEPDSTTPEVPDVPTTGEPMTIHYVGILFLSVAALTAFGLKKRSMLDTD